MDKQKDFDKDINVRIKMIEEMAKVIHDEYADWLEYTRADLNLALKLYNAGCCKIPEGAVMLTREQAKTFIHIKDLLGDFNDEITWEDFIELMDDIKKDTRKETAERFAERVSKAFLGVNCIDIDEWNWFRNKIDEICEEITGEENANE
jgi:hypothetical protein